MSYFERLIAIARDDEPALVAPMAAGPAPEPALVEEQVVADTPPEWPSTARTIATATARGAIAAAPDRSPTAREVIVERAAELLPRTPAHTPAVRPVAQAHDTVRVEPARHDVAIRTERAPPAEVAVSRTDHAPRPARAPAPLPAPADAPGIRALRDVMQWIAQPPEERAPAQAPTPMAAPPEPPARTTSIVEIHAAPAREAEASPARADDDRPIEVTIGEIEVTVEAPPAVKAPAAPPPRRRIVTRDTRLARRLPRSG